jgi:hypothetical protein
LRGVRFRAKRNPCYILNFILNFPNEINALGGSEVGSKLRAESQANEVVVPIANVIRVAGDDEPSDTAVR